ncbi:hypothetical protein [Cohnella terricola]|uniref:Uncharacterized protein n=1 Tax=Cohnella terricola TaxID=1289167 RepID=A0A559JEP0_9BACL|nr:hypothetical protein [Cohnella terricola]TVX98327.1 hypothetical protein FPZ45_16675 [Cohnella terricola]
MKSKKHALYFISSVACGFIMVWLFIFFLLNSSNSGLIAERHTDKAIRYFILFIIFLIAFLILIIKQFKLMKRLSIWSVVFIVTILVLLTPVIINAYYQLSEKYENKLAENKQNNSVIEIREIITKSKLKYQLDFEKSNKSSNLSPYQITYIYLTKESEDRLSSNEINELISIFPDRELIIEIREINLKNFIVVRVNSKKEIIDCTPFDICSEINTYY